MFIKSSKLLEQLFKNTEYDHNMPEMQKGDFADADAAVTVPDSASPSLFSDVKI